MENLHNPTERVLSIFDCLICADDGLTPKEITETTNIPKGTLSPILRTLSARRYLYLDKAGKYHVGIGCFRAGHQFLRTGGIMALIRTHMKQIVDECNEICQMGILDGTDVLYVEKIEPEQPIKLVSSVGRALPAYATAIGQALLAQFEDGQLRGLYPGGLKPLTSNTVTTMEALLEKVHDVQKKNYAHERGEASEVVECVAISLQNRRRTFAAISISIPIYRSSKEKIENMASLLLKSKKKLESSLPESSFDLFP